MGEQSETWQRYNVGRLLVKAVRRFETAVVAHLQARGLIEARMSYLKVILYIDVGGTRITELANKAQMTKQAMSELVMQCEALGLVRRLPDLEDARAKIVALTPVGLEWLDALGDAVRHAEAEMREAIGDKATASLIDALNGYCGSDSRGTSKSLPAASNRRSKPAAQM